MTDGLNTRVEIIEEKSRELEDRLIELPDLSDRKKKDKNNNDNNKKQTQSLSNQNN